MADPSAKRWLMIPTDTPVNVAEVRALPPRPRVVASFVSAPPEVDGSLSDPAWKLAIPSDGFTQKMPDEGKTPSDRTIVRVLYDRDNLYIGVECKQTHSRIVERLTRRDREVESDRVLIDLDTRGTGTNAFEFGVNASGVLLDAIRFNDTEISYDWDENWDAHTKVEPDRWTAEFRIPLRILRFDPSGEQSWGFQVRRMVSERQELDEWAYTPRSAGGEVSHYGKLEGLRASPPSPSLELRPFFLARARRHDASPDALEGGVDWKGSAGLDLKWHPTPSLTLEATVNPDFGQVEADQRVLNLTTFETYYPEKRAFFLEGIDTFASPMQLVYTRRIGRAAPTPTYQTNLRGDPMEASVDVPDPTVIYGATKLVGRIGDKWTVGALQAVTAMNQLQVQSLENLPDAPAGTRRRRLIDPLSTFNVLRVKHDVGENASIGIVGTGVTHAEPTGGYARLASDPTQTACPNGTTIPRGTRCTFNAYVASVDARWRSHDGDYSAFAQATTSVLQGGYVRPVPDGTSIHSGDVGHGATANVAKDGGHWTGWLWGEYDTPKLDYNDMGFMQRANFAGGGLGIDYRTLERWGPTLETKTSFGSYVGYNTYGVPIGTGAGLAHYAKLTNFWTVNATLRTELTWFDDREVSDGHGTALERPAGIGYDLSTSSDTTKRVSFSLASRGMTYEEGHLLNAKASMMMHVLPQWDLEVLPSVTYTRGQPRFTQYDDDQGRPLFGRLEATSFSTTLRSTYTFTPRLTLQTYAQLFVASEHYSDFAWAAPLGDHALVHFTDLHYGATAPAINPDNERGALNVNVVLRWEYRLGSLLYVVYTRAQIPNVRLGPGDEATPSFGLIRRAPATDEFLVKLSYWWG
jgi:hypothetical protein